jgi:hypothetical protein
VAERLNARVLTPLLQGVASLAVHRRLLLLSLVGIVATAGWTPSARPLAAPRADLRVQLSRLPTETRVDGNVIYRAVVRNIGRRTAKDVAIDVEASPLLVAVSTRAVSCNAASAGLRCITASLRPRAAAEVALTIRALGLGAISVKASASTVSAEVTLRNNAASATTPVVAPDSVRVEAFYLAPSFRQDISLNAISGRRGEDPDGTLIMDWFGRVSGTVTCVNVSGNRAVVGIMTPPVVPPPGATATPFLLFGFTDNGSPGAGRDTFSLIGSAAPISCWFPWPADAPQTGSTVIPITSGEVTIIDTP